MGSDSSVPLTLEEHRELSQEVSAASRRLHELCDLVHGVYGPNNQAAFTFLKVIHELDRLCLDLQAQAQKDLPGCDVEDLYQQ